VALAGATVSQVAFELAVKLVAPLELLIAIVWEAGADPLCVCENDNDAGVAVTVELAPDTVNVTGTEMVDDPAVMVMAPW
jgi:hypothetical protein